MKIAIVGGRDFSDYELLKSTLIKYLYKRRNMKDEIIESKDFADTIVSGGAKGADTLGEKFAKEYGFKTEIYLPNWNLYGKQAGFIRNISIIENADIVFAFWDGKSKGTQHSINLAKQKNKELYIINY